MVYLISIMQFAKEERYFMTLEKLSLNVYDEYRDTIDRYMELIPCEQRDKVDTATVHIMYAIQDINNQIEKYNLGKLDISIFYQMMIKTDFLISIIETLYEIFEANKKRRDIWGTDYHIIQKFRLYRSLTLAHPLETTRYEEFGFGRENEKWCQDIHVKGKMESSFFSEIKDADFVMEIMEKGKSFPNRKPIYIQKDILSATSICLQHLQSFTHSIFLKLISLKETLKSIPIEANKEMCIKDYINSLVKDLEKRYPTEIEKIVYEDNTTEVNCILYQALEYLDYYFTDPMREEQYRAYKSEIEQAIYEYGSSVQNMDLEETQAHEKLSGLLYPNCSALCDKSSIEQVHYRYEKVAMYLSNSKERSIETAIEKLKKYSYDGCRNVGVCTNAEWGAIQLFTLQDELNPYFQIDFNATDKELFLQFCTALYYANKSL